MKNKNLYEFISEEQNIQNCHNCPNKGQCEKEEVCLVEAHKVNINKGFTPYNQATYDQRRLL